MHGIHMAQPQACIYCPAHLQNRAAGKKAQVGRAHAAIWVALKSSQGSRALG